MPVDYSRYPKNWKLIRAEILKRAGGRCECSGECRKPHMTGSVTWVQCPEFHGDQPSTFGGERVVLTIAHLNHNPKDSRRRNLKAMCQACHLRYDAPMKAQKRKRAA